MGGYFQGSTPFTMPDGSALSPGLPFINHSNTGIFYSTLLSGIHGIAMSFNAIPVLFLGVDSVGIGGGALQNLGTGSSNTAIGLLAGGSVDIGNLNTFIGAHVANNITSGSENVAIGAYAFNNNATGSHNVLIGANAGSPIIGNYSNRLYICSYQTDTPLIYGTFDPAGGLLGTLQINGVFSALGTTTNDNAGAGQIGEYIESAVAVGAAVNLTTNTPANITSIALTPGDWDVSGFIGFAPAATTSITHTSGSSSTTTGTMDVNGQTALSTPAIVPGAGTDWVQAIPVRRISIAVATTVYLVEHAIFTVSTMGGYGTIHARRMR